MKPYRDDDFLNLLQKSQRGKLKIYVGSSAGVGKTYRMLADAHALRKDGVDVVLGFIETHGRAETEAMIGDLEIIPRFQTEYHGVKVEEMNIHEIIRRKPSLVVIDELPHTNLPICKNDKRYKDVIEILAQGIDVICALNIQHLESLNDIVYEIAGIRVMEVVPDDFLTYADQIVNIDISTEDLIQRLKDGKIYPNEKIQSALKNFFKIDTLGQLRELSLREVASRLELKKDETAKTGLEWRSSETMLICMTPATYSQSTLIRAASKLAGKLNTDWHAVYIETPSDKPEYIASEVQRMLYNDIELVKKLGARFHHVKAKNRFEGFYKFAKSINARHIILDQGDYTYLNILLGKSLVHLFVREKSFNLHLLNNSGCDENNK